MNMLLYDKLGENGMLKYFRVKNYKGFEDGIELDFSNHRDYSFHQEFIKNGIINKGLIYGKNGSGKSNFGLALFDIVYHLTDNFKPDVNLSYQNGNQINKPVEFEYVFTFNNGSIKYKYGKLNQLTILYEKLYINNQLVVDFDFSNQNIYTLMLKEADTLKIGLLRPEQSFVRYIYDHCSFDENHLLCKLMRFVDKMLWFRSVNNNQFGGYKESPEQLTDMLDNKNAVKDFENFLLNVDSNLNFNLSIEKDLYNRKILMVNYSNNSKLPFTTVASTGTLSLWLFYCWSLEFDNISFLFIDEFDAYYHYETSEHILNLINSKINFQSLISTHNTNLMNNAIIRPDCCFIISCNKSIKSLPECTDKEIREAHNLERMYKNGGFTI